LEYRRNRQYDPQAGRFTQEDPIGLAGGLNLYGFANGDPVTFSDPFGLCKNPPCPEKGSLGSQLLGALKRGIGRVIDKITGGGLAAVDVARDVQPGTTRNDVTNAVMNPDLKGVSMTGTLTVPFPPALSSASVTCCPNGTVEFSASPGLAAAVTADVTYVKPGATPNVGVGFYGGEGAYLGGGVLFQDSRLVGTTTSVGVGMGFRSAQHWVAGLFSFPIPR
jgi:hypothetical protein